MTSSQCIHKRWAGSLDFSPVMRWWDAPTPLLGERKGVRTFMLTSYLVTKAAHIPDHWISTFIKKRRNRLRLKKIPQRDITGKNVLNLARDTNLQIQKPLWNTRESISRPIIIKFLRTKYKNSILKEASLFPLRRGQLLWSVVLQTLALWL